MSDRLDALLGEQGGVAAVDYLMDRLIEEASLPSDEEAVRECVAAIIRAALLVEERAVSPLFVEFRPDERVLLVRSLEAGADAQHMGDEADRAVRRDGVVSARAAVEALSHVVPHGGQIAVPAERLLALACQCSHHAVLSPSGSIYRRGLPPADALKHSRAMLAKHAQLTESELRELVSASFPEAVPLPKRPGLDSLVASTISDWPWSKDVECYVRHPKS